jgi:hypothetical protein
MSLQNLVLPDFLISELYKKLHLVDDGSSGEKRSQMAAGDPNILKFLGNNQKNIAILVHHPGEVFLPERHLDFLIKMLGACKLNIADVAIFNEGFTRVDMNTHINKLHTQKVILFVIEPTDLKLPMSFPQFKLQEYALCNYLYVPSLDNLNTETEEGKLLKTKLWICLKTMFDVSGPK